MTEILGILPTQRKKTLVKDKERTIIEYMDSIGGTATPNEVSKFTGISYVTVRKYLDKLVKEGILEVEDGEEKDKKK